jgi:hypothetical protein
MRFKFVLLTSLLGAAVGASVSIAIIALARNGFAFTAFEYHTNRLLVLLVYAPAILLSLLAGIFVYRHTARRRKFQAALTGMLVLSFWFIALVAVLLYVSVSR